jgi:hypothetical protein
MVTMKSVGNYHYAGDAALAMAGHWVQVDRFTYTFENFFHPFVGDMIEALNRGSIADLLDPNLQAKTQSFFAGEYKVQASDAIKVTSFDKAFDLTLGGPYANYNWEILFHIPVMVAVHLSNNQRFAEAQQWFHYVFDPTCTDASVPTPQRFWKFNAFRQGGPFASIDALLALLSTPDDQLDATTLQAKQAVEAGYATMLTDPFQPHAIARTRITAYQYYVVMKYLDNLIAWGDSLFLQNTIETLNEATLCYVLAADVLGPRPQPMPPVGTVTAQNFAQLKQAQLDAMSNAMIELEGQFPFNLTPATGQGGGSDDLSGPLFGIGRSLYFCIPPNQTLLGYWDIVSDRLFKIRNSENIQGVVQELPLFDPPLDPGMLVKAAAAGLDIGSIVSGLNQPLSPMRAPMLIQKALEIAGEVRALGGTLLAALEKGDAERLAQLRQGHEIALHQLTQNVRFLQWRQAQAATNALLKARDSALETYTYYLRLIGLKPDAGTVPPTLALERRTLTEDNFDDVYDALVGTYDKTIGLQPYASLQLAGSSSPSSQSGASGNGALYLNTNEDSEVNSHMPTARDTRLASSVATASAIPLSVIPDFNVHLHYWGIGASSKITGGSFLSASAKFVAEVLQIAAAYETNQAEIASKTATYQRRADEWALKVNDGARQLMHIGRQIIASLIGEQVAYHEYSTVKTQVQQARDVQDFLKSKFTNADFYGWMQSQAAGLYYQCYRFAFDTARRAEQTMKQELMRPELAATDFIQFNYWDQGHRGLLSGEALYLDVKRMELAYHDHNKRELELTRHVSLRQLDPLALLTLKVTGACTVSLPEWLFDRDCPGHYMRRIKTVSVSVPSVVGPYASINCTLTLQRSTIRVSPLLRSNNYTRDSAHEDDRFVDIFGSVDELVTSGATNDGGMFETNLRDERFLPFEGTGTISTWNLALPAAVRTFDYMTISDVILHIRYTAREGGAQFAGAATKALLALLAPNGAAPQTLMFCLRYDFPTEWTAFVNGTGNFATSLRKDYFPYMAQSGKITVDQLALYAQNGAKVVSVTPPGIDLAALSTALNGAAAAAALALPPDPAVLQRVPAQQAFLMLRYHFTP